MSSVNMCKIGSWNVHSMFAVMHPEKPTRLASFILENEFDIFGITETWSNSHTRLKAWCKKHLANEYNIISDIIPGNDMNYHGKGSVIVYNRIWAPYVHRIHRIHKRFVGVLLKRHGEHIFIGNIYFPADQNHQDDINQTTHELKTILKNLV